MNKISNWWFIIVIQLGLLNSSTAQELTFFRLDKSDGLSDNTINSVVTDKYGLVWIGTTNGLNSYDGYSVKTYFSKDNPGLVNDQIVRMVCDDNNRIWIQCGSGALTLLDEKRQFHRIELLHGRRPVLVDYILPVTDNPMFLHKGRVYGLLDKNALRFGPLEMAPDPLLENKFERINKWDKDNLVFSGSGWLFLFDTKKLKVTKSALVPDVVAAAKLSDDVAIVTRSNKEKLSRVSFTTGVEKPFQHLNDQHGEPMHVLPGSVMPLHDQSFLITSPSAGVYVFDAGKEMLTRHSHDIFDGRTISSNHTAYISPNDDGYFFITTIGAGLNYFKLNSQLAGIKTVFNDNLSGKVYNGYISDIAEDAKGNIWMAGSNALIEWSPAIGETFIRWLNPGDAQEDHRGGIRTLYIDKDDRIWAGFSHELVVFSKSFRILATLDRRSGLPDNTINDIIGAPDGALLICTPKGMCFVDPATFAVRIPPPGSPLAVVQGKNCNTAWFRKEDELWIGTWSGAHCVNLSNGDVKTYTTENGLIFNEVIGFAGDRNGCVYIGTRMGFHILEPGNKVKAFSHVNNAWAIDCYSFVADYAGNIWFSSNNYIASYSTETKKFNVYDEKAGINPSGFWFYAAHATRSGDLIFGSNKGVTYFRPENIPVTEGPLSVLIHGVETLDSTYSFLPGENIELPYYVGTISFSFSVIDLLREKNILLQYKLRGVDKNWTKATSGQRITYNRLQPGDYLFSVKASGDGLTWTTVSDPVRFSIMTPWWQHRWFVALTVLVTGSAVVLLIIRRNRNIRRQREDLEIEQAINYLATSLHEQSDVESILWDVTRNCIGRLQFEDCVIYLVDKERNVLVQKAAWGPKTTPYSDIRNPIEIPMGKGIVGSVAQSGRAEIVADTSKDRRYIVDDAVRLSEITVPIVYEGKTLGVIDSEHSKRGFFTEKHLSILTTVASLCANKMVRAKAENEKQEAQLAILRHEKEVVKAQLKSLRLQMNPHFLFNSLNSLQQMILAGQDRDATRYLSKFSRLLRLVLLHSDKENITLKEELETLNLYIELELLRFKESFHYDITCDGTIDKEEIKIPVMLIQPFVENAIWHGLLHKQGSRYLKIEFLEDSDETMICVIEDNGIGREAAGRIRNDHHTKMGIAVAMERLKTQHPQHNVQDRLRIDDIIDERGNAAGTRVVLRLYQQ